MKKICTKCHQPKPATKDFFNKDVRTKDGLRGDCKKCCREAEAKRKVIKRELVGGIAPDRMFI